MISYTESGELRGQVNLKGIANDIKKTCGGKLYAVVATHRHKDHISGFSDAGGAESPGAIIASCKPEVVLQPWAENPDAAANATAAPLLARRQAISDEALFFASMSAMNSIAAAVAEEASGWRGVGGRVLPLERLAANNVSNPDAVKNLRTMGKRSPRFLQYGSPSGLENSRMLPGVKVHILGPPTQKMQNLRKYAKNSDEYWIGCKYWGLQSHAVQSAGSSQLFRRDVPKRKRRIPFEARWFIQRADGALKANTLAIVTMLDNFLNNTSLILLFEVNGKKFLFPGDAQWENWSWALSQKGIKNLLKNVSLNKVGNHGSRNATPKDLWNMFAMRKGQSKSGALTTMMSTAPGVYGRSEEGKVSSANLVKTLKEESSFSSTQDLKKQRGPIIVEF